MTLRIVLVEDHQIVLEGLKLIVESQPDLTVVACAQNGQDAISVIERTSPDIVVFDISMPLMNGIRMIDQLKIRGLTPKLLALTANEDIAYLNQLLKNGVEGYLLKRSAGVELVTAIRTIGANKQFIDTSFAERRLQKSKHHENRIREFAALSDREAQVLMLLAKGFTNKEVAVKLNISVKTIETHKSRSMLKCGLRSRAEIVRYAISQGWLDAE